MLFYYFSVKIDFFFELELFELGLFYWKKEKSNIGIRMQKRYFQNLMIIIRNYCNKINWMFDAKNFQQIRQKTKNQTVNINPLNANITKWSNTLKQFVGKLPKNCFSVFDHFVGLALKGLRISTIHLQIYHFSTSSSVFHKNHSEDVSYC